MILGNKEKILYEKRIRLYKVRNDDEWNLAIKETRAMNRIPVYIRTPRNKTSMNEAIHKIVAMLHLPEESNEINLRKVFADCMGNPIKKNEQRDKLNIVARKAIL